MPAAIYVETQGGIAYRRQRRPRRHRHRPHLHRRARGGHARRSSSSTCAPAASQAGGEQGSAAKWAHAAMALAVRARSGARLASDAALDPAAVLRDGRARAARGRRAARARPARDLGPADARALLRAWLQSVDLDRPLRGRPRRLHAGRALHARRPATAARRARTSAAARRGRQRRRRQARRDAGDDGRRRSSTACIPAIPYAPPAAFLARERAKLAARDGEPPRVAIVADGIGAMHGVTRTIEEIRERGVAGFEIEVIGTDPNVDRRLGAVADVEIPFYPGMQIGVRACPRSSRPSPTAATT